MAFFFRFAITNFESFLDLQIGSFFMLISDFVTMIIADQCLKINCKK